MECSLIQAALDWDCLPQPAREDYQNHLRFCLACKKRIAREAPDKLLFLLTDNEELPHDFWLGFWDSLVSKIDSVPGRKSGKYLVFLRWAAVLCAAVFLISFENTTVKQMTKSMGPILKTFPAAQTFHYPLVEELNNPKARYYIFQPNENEKIVMILDPDIEL